MVSLVTVRVLSLPAFINTRIPQFWVLVYTPFLPLLLALAIRHLEQFST